MSLFPLPVKVRNRIDALRRGFIWKGNRDKRNIHLVNCDYQKNGRGRGHKELKSTYSNLAHECLRHSLKLMLFEEQLSVKNILKQISGVQVQLTPLMG